MAVGRGLHRAPRAPCLRDGERRTDLALRLETDEVPFEIADSVDQALTRLKTEQPDITKVDVIANYTAFQQIRTAYGRVQ